MEIRTDVLVIGGGGAACSAALAAADSGAGVILASKLPVSKGGATCHAVAETAAYNAGNPSIAGDVEKHYADIMFAAQGMASAELAAILAAEAPLTVRNLESWGLSFDKKDADGKEYFLSKSCFARSPRSHIIRGHGESIIKVMARQLKLRAQIRVLDSLTVAGLLVHDGVCAGAYGWNGAGEEILIRAGAVILATGGVCQAFERNLNPRDVTGDGYALAFQAGVKLVNMEFMQIGMGICHPIVHIFNAYSWPGLPKLLNAAGEEFLEKDLPAGLSAKDVLLAHSVHFPFSSTTHSKYLEIAIQREIKSGRGTPSGGVAIDLRHMTDAYSASVADETGCSFHRLWPIARDHIKACGLDLLKQPAELCCFAHAINGGVRIDRSASSSLPGLYAAGETAGGPHGADRLGGNMLVTCQVFGAIAGRSAAGWAMRNPVYEAPSAAARAWRENIEERRASLTKKINPEELHAALRLSSQKNLMVSRNEKGLAETRETCAALEKEIAAAPAGNAVNPRSLELLSMLTSIKLMASAALERKESRGSHHREDYPAPEAKYALPFVLENAGGEVRVKQEAFPG